MTREREMLRLREVDHLTLREIGERYDLTAERVRQILNQCRRRMRQPDRPAAGRSLPSRNPRDIGE